MTIFYILFVLLALAIVFGVTYKIKGLKIALAVTGAGFVCLLVLYIGMVYLITASMG
ncbi:MAG: hypothetical protein IT311_01075 [Anaerolineales bacterium]|nr:hypothetical protein [Anaerolineales bacterium]MCZ2123492.1 hypothetical protein [Anaerolineales bacterium]